MTAEKSGEESVPLSLTDQEVQFDLALHLLTT